MLNGNLRIQAYHRLPSEAKEIRKRVFVCEQGFGSEFDDIDDTAVHFVAYTDEDTAIGTCRLFSRGDVFCIGRVAILKEYRGLHIGSALLSECEHFARSCGARELRLLSQCSARAFYHKAGYSEFGNIIFDEGCPHIGMRKLLREEENVT